VTRPIRFGIQLPEVERDVRWPEIVSMARAAEASEFDSVWLGDHLLYRDDGRRERGPWDAWTMLAGLAAVTDRVRLGPLVACLGFHPPGVFARMAAGVNEIADGRLVLGMGAGWNEAEFRAFGIPFDHRIARFEEAFGIVRRLLEGERVTVSGRFWQVEDAVLLPAAARRPSMMVGSSGERVLGMTLPHVDSWNTWFDLTGNTPEGFARENAKITAAAERAGRDARDIERSACVLVLVDPASDERPRSDDYPPLEGSMATIARGLLDLAEAGADEAIIVASPITEGSIRALGEAIAIVNADGAVSPR
jgi:alkanesulfonate monooxygenase SsuD/methylene tetrahydromethanopterin reductase-like flavin-dependent oxidoreductase (luciferase family)